MVFLWATLLVLAAALFWTPNLFGLPGNWLMIAAAILYAFLEVGAGSRFEISWVLVIILVVLATLGEVVEFAAGAVGASHAGGSKRGAMLALLGSMVGGLVGVLVGVPVPILGPVIGALLFAGFGALVGAVLGEQWKGRDLDTSVRIGRAAFWGRLAGTMGKIIVGAVMMIVLTAGVIF